MKNFLKIFLLPGSGVLTYKLISVITPPEKFIEYFFNPISMTPLELNKINKKNK